MNSGSCYEGGGSGYLVFAAGIITGIGGGTYYWYWWRKILPLLAAVITGISGGNYYWYLRR